MDLSSGSVGGTPNFAFTAANGTAGFNIDPFTKFTFYNSNSGLLLNGGTAYRMAQSGAGHYAQMTDDRLMEELYLSGLCRFPTDRERDTARKIVRARQREVRVARLGQ